jgi:alpha-galactosidase
MIQHIIFEAEESSTTFAADGEQKTWLQRLWGLTCGLSGDDAGPPRARGLGVLISSQGRFEADSLNVAHTEIGETCLSMVWTLSGGLLWESRWTLCPASGIWSRRDTLRNASEQRVVIFRCLARFPFSPASYELYSQHSSWCNENQGSWQTLDHGGLQLYCRGGRTTQGSTPYLLLRERESRQAVAFHLLPRGNWILKASTCVAGGDSLPFVVVEAGLSDEELALELQPGDTLELPELLIQHLPQGQPEAGAPHLHRYLASRAAASNRALPVVYNTWFDAFEELDPARLHRQLAAAVELGCEVFAVDAGWYGAGEGSWAEKVGDWQESEHRAFQGRMAEFGDAVRAAGLGFGLWMEPERNHPSAPTVRAHPEWFLPGAQGFVYPDLSQPAAYGYIHAEMSRLIESYALAWMKVDFNFELGSDPAELTHYTTQWYKLLDELRRAYPNVILEGCASGGMRSDLHTVSHFDCHFLSDTVHPVEVLRIRQGALLRLPPGKLAAWIVLRPIGRTVPHYGQPLDAAPESAITPRGATWQESVTVDVDFAARIALPGMLGLSGDIAGLAGTARQQLRRHIAFYQRWRSLIANSAGYLLTPVRAKRDATGWAALQLQGLADPASLVFAYRLDDGTRRRWFALQGLENDRRYVVTLVEAPDSPGQTFTGRQLMTGGLPVDLTERYNAAVFVVAPEAARRAL